MRGQKIDLSQESVYSNKTYVMAYFHGISQDQAVAISSKQTTLSSNSMAMQTKNICKNVSNTVKKSLQKQQYGDTLKCLCEHYELPIDQFFKNLKEMRLSGSKALSHYLWKEKQWEMEKDPAIKKVFTVYFIWFVRERYVRHLIYQGKMKWPLEYIKYIHQNMLSTISKEAGQEVCSVVETLIKGQGIFTTC